MMTRLKAILVHCAIGLIALQTVLAGFAPVVAAQPTLDPFAVICHSGDSNKTVPSDQSGHQPQACDHCVLCNATTAAADAPAVLSILTPAIVTTSLAPVRIDIVPSRVNAGRKLATGPPLTV